MADILVKYYQYVAVEAGYIGKLKLAQLTKLPLTRAAMEPDTPELIEAFNRAVAAVTGKPTPDL